MTYSECLGCGYTIGNVETYMTGHIIMAFGEKRYKWRSLPIGEALLCIFAGNGMEGIDLYYVIQTAPGMEEKTEIFIQKMIPDETYTQCFHLTRRRRKKFHGQWKDVLEKLLPGYVFIISEDIIALYLELKKIPVLTKMLGKEDIRFTPLTNRDIEWLMRLTGNSVLSRDSNHKIGEICAEIGLSQISVSAKDEIVIISGPLKGMEGMVKKINLHKRMAEVEVDFMNRKTIIYLGIEMIENKEACSD